MKLLLDQGLPLSSASLLHADGIATIHVGELGMSAAPDDSIIEYARSSGYCIVTLDADFHSWIATSLATSPSVIRLRVQRLKAADAADLLRTVLPRVGRDLPSGCFVTVTKESIRLRRLPIRRPQGSEQPAGKD